MCVLIHNSGNSPRYPMYGGLAGILFWSERFVGDKIFFPCPIITPQFSVFQPVTCSLYQLHCTDGYNILTIFLYLFNIKLTIF